MVEAVRSWLEAERIPVRRHAFTLRPYFMELLGLWMALTGLLLPVAALARWGWGGLLLTLLALAVPLLEVRFTQPTITALIRRRAHNLVVSFPAPRPQREVLLCAHLDSKTELLDHYRRARLIRLGRPTAGLALVCGALVAAESLLSPGAAATAVRGLAVLAALPVTAYGLGMAATLVGGRFSRRPSSGAVDNGAAVAVLLTLAHRLRHSALRLKHTSVTLLFTVGEEAQMQGALAYAKARRHGQAHSSVPSSAVNLEALGQDGGYLLWERDGTALHSLPTAADLNDALERAVKAVAGESPLRVPAIKSDAFAFLCSGIPSTTLGSFDLELGGRGLHSALDHPGRVRPARLSQAANVLCRLLADWGI